ncbi:hypothetical protein QAD02_005349, partial [Eretmocerus hayati]
LDQVDRLLRNSETLLQKLGASPELIYLMYVILKDCWADDNEAMRRITKAIIQMKALKEHQDSESNIHHHPRCSRSIGTLGSPTYIGQVPHVNIAATTSKTLGCSVNSFELPSTTVRDLASPQEQLSCSDLENIEAQVKKVAKLLTLFGYPWDINSVSYMYVIIQAAKGNTDVAERVITDAVIEIRRSEHFKALMLSSPHCSGYMGSLRTLGNPMLLGAIPYFGVSLSPTMANLNLLPSTMISQPLKVPLNSESPPDQPASYHGKHISTNRQIFSTPDSFKKRAD